MAALESRRADDLSRLIEKFGGIPAVSPSMRETPLGDPRSVVDFANRLITGQIDGVIVMTGVGFRQMLDQIDRHVDRTRFLDALSDVTTVARGPKPVAAMKEVGLTPTWRVPEPNTWREILAVIDRDWRVANLNVAIQEYGKTNPSLIAGLEARGATVVPVQVYRWELPEDPEPLRENIRAIAAGRRDLLLFTSAQQVVHLLAVAEELGAVEDVRRQLRRMAVVSVGPTTSEALRDEGLPVDIEPEHPKMAPMVQAAADRAAEVLARKRAVVESVGSVPGRAAGEAARSTPAWVDSPFLKACRREPTEYTPVWLMRQAGRYMSEYRAVRARTSFLELCKNPELCAEVMVTAVDKLGVDAAIIFSDLLPILEPMGLQLEFLAGDGPAIHNPVREPADVDRVRELDALESLDFVFETVRRTRAALSEKLPVIGFAGAPFTLASYAIEGGGSRNYLHTKALMYRDPGAWNALLGKFARSVVRYLNAQIAAGAQCVQLFDSWVGCLSPDDYREFVLPHMRAIIAGIEPGVPVINFGAGNPALLPLLAEAGSAVVGIDWRVRLDDAWRTVGYDRAVQGNLDPATLLGPLDALRRQVRRVLDQAEGRPGHIFNLGHGIVPSTPVEHAQAVVEMVHEMSRRSNGAG